MVGATKHNTIIAMQSPQKLVLTKAKALPFVMMVVMNVYWIPDPMSLAFLLPLILAW